MRCLIGVMLCWCCLTSAGVAAEMHQRSLPMRLPGSVVPLAYTLDLTVNPDRARHEGTVSIDVDLREPTRLVRLHATDLVIRSAVLHHNGQTLRGQPSQRDEDLLDLRFERLLPAGPAKLVLRFTGRVDDKDSAGLFRQKEGGDWYAFTQFEATYARRAFPSFDEPGWKVPWTLSLTIPQNLMAVANTPVTGERSAGRGLKRVQFETTRPLPSYLLAFGVGPFDVLDGGKARGTPIRFVTPRGRAQEARYAAIQTSAIVEKLEDYFGIPYPYGKLDVLAVPITLGFGAMENPGLITFSSRLMLAKPAEESARFKRDYVAIQAHELAHQWFGNYVTMAWWDDLWLNESFASWMGDKITEQVAPEWRFETAVQDARATAMQTDRLASTRRIHQPVNDKQSLASAFDSITYSKGQVTLAMFETWLGVERFREGVRRYMRRHAWGSATGDEFLAALADGDTQIQSAFKSFISQPGIPKLSLSLLCDGSPRLRITQSRFLPKGSAAVAQSSWQVPVTVRTPAGVRQFLLREPSGEMPLPDAQCPAWVEANAGGAGYYRPVYADGQLAALLSRSDIDVREVLANLDDAQALTESGDLSEAEALSMALPFASHPRREVSDAALEVIGTAERLLEPSQSKAYAAVWQRAYGQQARRLGLLERKDESEDDRLSRGRWLSWVAEAGQDQTLRTQATDLTRAWLNDRSIIDARSRLLVLRVAALSADRALFDALVKAAVGNPDRRERADIYAAVSNVRDPALRHAARALWLSPQHDIREVMKPPMPRHDEAAYDALHGFIVTNFRSLTKRLPKDAPGEFPNLFGELCSAPAANQLERFFGPIIKRYDGGESSLQRSLENIRLCAVYRQTQRDSLSSYLRQF
jgi:cytosol alanyl aminopeptidase